MPYAYVRFTLLWLLPAFNPVLARISVFLALLYTLFDQLAYIVIVVVCLSLMQGQFKFDSLVLKPHKCSLLLKEFEHFL